MPNVINQLTASS